MKKEDRCSYTNYSRDRYAKLQQQITGYSKDMTSQDFWKNSKNYPGGDRRADGRNWKVARVHVVLQTRKRL